MTDPKVIQKVVSFLGFLTLLGFAIIGALLIISQVNEKPVDTAAIGIISGLTGSALGGLTALLVATGSKDEVAAPEPVPAQVQNVLARLSQGQIDEMVQRLQTHTEVVAQGDQGTAAPSYDVLPPA